LELKFSKRKKQEIMVNSKFKLRAGLIFQRLLPWVVTIGIFAFLFHKIPITKVYEAAAHVNLWTFVPVIIIGFIMYFLWDVLIFTLLFKEVGSGIPYLGMLTIRGAAYLLSIVNHFVGAGSIALLMNRLKNKSISQTGSIVILKIFLEYYGIMALCLLTAFQIPGIDLKLFFENSEKGHFIRLIILSWICFVAVLLFFHLVLPNSQGFKGIKSSKILSAFRDVLPHKQFVFILIHVIGFFFFDILVVFLALMVFGLKIPFLFFIVFFPVVRLIEVIPVSVMGLGTSQMAMIWLFTPYVENAASEAALTASILAFSLLVTIFSNLGRFVVGAISIRILP
jgi:uncharacterized membrane protein YbhN (UPF0104 family)